MSLHSLASRFRLTLRLLRLKAQPVVALLRRIRADELDVVAAWLAYTTLLSLVPLVALVLVIANYVPGFAEVHSAFDQLLVKYLLPEKAGNVIANYTLTFSANATRFTLLGISFLLVVVWAMFWAIEQAFNRIWRLAPDRPLYSSASALLVVTVDCAGGPRYGLCRCHVGSFALTGFFYRTEDYPQVHVWCRRDVHTHRLPGMAELCLAQLPCSNRPCADWRYFWCGRHCLAAVGLWRLRAAIFKLCGGLWRLFDTAGLSALALSLLAHGAVGLCRDCRVVRIFGPSIADRLWRLLGSGVLCHNAHR